MILSIYSIGHSTHSRSRFRDLLCEHGIEAVMDIRRFPGSRKFPRFNQDNLAVMLEKARIDYQWLEALGGRRSKQRTDSPNAALTNRGFRNYADYMLTAAFQRGFSKLLRAARKKRTAMLCAEGLFWRCHRRLVSDLLVARGAVVVHIMPNGILRPHTLTNGAVLKNGLVTYPCSVMAPQ
jgi:uncharacterized protein (DUF488 family)